MKALNNHILFERTYVHLGGFGPGAVLQFNVGLIVSCNSKAGVEWSDLYSSVLNRQSTSPKPVNSTIRREQGISSLIILGEMSNEPFGYAQIHKYILTFIQYISGTNGSSVKVQRIGIKKLKEIRMS